MGRSRSGAAGAVAEVPGVGQGVTLGIARARPRQRDRLAGLPAIGTARVGDRAPVRGNGEDEIVAVGVELEELVLQRRRARENPKRARTA